MLNIFAYIIVLLLSGSIKANPLLAPLPPVLTERNVSGPNTISTSVLELLHLTGIRPQAKTLQEAVLLVQSSWLRQPGKEHWDTLARFASINALGQREKALTLFNTLHMLEEIRPMYQEFDYILFLGGLATNMRKQMGHLLRLRQEINLKTKKIFVLSGERPLVPAIEPAAVILGQNDREFLHRKDWHPPAKLPTIELEAARLIFSQAALPPDWEVSFVSTPMQFRNGSKCRPITKDMVDTWMRQTPLPGRILAITVNPFTAYQLEVLRTQIPKSFVIDIAGSPANLKEVSLDILFDVLARWMYQLNIRMARQG